MESGTVIAEFTSPIPAKGQAPHRYLFLAYEQRGQINPIDLEKYISQACQFQNRNGFNLNGFVLENNLVKSPVAANYFTVEYDKFVDSIVEYCQDKF